jgi:F-type H+-transporting ATPase subunit O
MLAGRLAAQAARQAARSSPIAPRAFARTYAAQASPANTRPPVALYGIDGTYASALVRQLEHD